MYYTLGQRRGLDIGGVSGGTGERWFVVKKDLENNVLVVSQGEDGCLFSQSLTAANVNFIPEKPGDTFECYAKTRYRQDGQLAKVTVLSEKEIRVDFKQKQRAVTPGQYVVLYDEKNCLGGGVIL